MLTSGTRLRATRLAVLVATVCCAIGGSSLVADASVAPSQGATTVLRSWQFGSCLSATDVLTDYAVVGAPCDEGSAQEWEEVNPHPGQPDPTTPYVCPSGHGRCVASGGTWDFVNAANGQCLNGSWVPGYGWYMATTQNCANSDKAEQWHDYLWDGADVNVNDLQDLGVTGNHILTLNAVGGIATLSGNSPFWPFNEHSGSFDFKLGF